MSANIVNPQALGAQSFADRNAINRDPIDLGALNALQKLAKANVSSAFNIEAGAAPKLPTVLSSEKKVNLFYHSKQ